MLSLTDLFRPGLDDARSQLAAWRQSLLDLFGQVDLLALPAMPVFPPRLAGLTPDSLLDVIIEITQYIALFNAAGTPCTAQPIRAADTPIPASLQLVGPRGARNYCSPPRASSRPPGRRPRLARGSPAAPAVTGSRRSPGPLACPARYDRRMAYDEDLAARIRNLIGPDPELTEKKMFGGLAFLIRGHMAISASGQGGVLVHVDSERSAGLVAATGATTAVMQGREMPGWLRVSPDDLASDDDLSRWVEIGIGHARSLPPKQPAKAKLKK